MFIITLPTVSLGCGRCFFRIAATLNIVIPLNLWIRYTYKPYKFVALHWVLSLMLSIVWYCLAYTVKKLGNYLPNILPNVEQIVNPTNSWVTCRSFLLGIMVFPVLGQILLFQQLSDVNEPITGQHTFLTYDLARRYFQLLVKCWSTLKQNC